MTKELVRFMCLHCPHSEASLRKDGTCGGLDAAGDTCECPQFVPDRQRPVAKQKKPERRACDWLTSKLEKLGEIGLQAYLDNSGRNIDERWALVADVILRAAKRKRM